MPKGVDLNTVLTPLEPNDITIIREWEPYPAEFSELDYALREGGWLDEFSPDPNTHIFSAKYENKIIGFSLLSAQSDGTEFRIALKPDKIGKGFGRIVALATITEYYKLHEYNTLYLIVRLTNTVAQRLYESIGFIPDQELTKNIQGIPVRFLKMKYIKG